MGWISRYGKWQDDFAPPAPNPVRFKHLIAALLFFSLFLGCVAFFPLLLIFVPKPQLVEYTPPGMYCATCKEMWEHNRDLFNREEMLCYGPPTYVSIGLMWIGG
jgi:hypothetical protein